LQAPDDFAMAVAAAATPVAETWVVGDLEPETETSTCWGPALVPSVQVIEARPWSSVATAEAATVPPPELTMKLRLTSATTVLPESVARTTTTSGSICPTVALWPPPETTASTAAACCTMTATVAEALPEDAVTVAVPFWTAVSKPEASTVTTEGSSLDRLIVPLKDCPFWSRTVAASARVASNHRAWRDRDHGRARRLKLGH